VFVQEDGSPYHPQRFAHMLRRLALAAGVPAIRFHDLRHTSATLALLAGNHPKVVQERLGHANVSITLDTYSHVLPNLQREAAQKLDSLVAVSPPRRSVERRSTATMTLFD
jgi:integrase